MAEFDEAEARARAQMRELIKKHTERRAGDGRRDDASDENASPGVADDQADGELRQSHGRSMPGMASGLAAQPLV